MKIKKYRARTFREALALVKREMGDDAVILSSEEQKGFRASVEITAAVDYDTGSSYDAKTISAYHLMAGTCKEPEPLSEEEGSSDDMLSEHCVAVSSEDKTPEAAGITEMRRDILSLKETIEDMKNRGYEVAVPEGRRKVFRYLRKRAIREDLALQLCRSASNMKELVQSLSSGIKTYPDTEDRKVVILIGPTGVGKTTTLAKMAARAIKQGKRVAMINLDTYRIGAIEQIRIYSKILGIPLDIASNTEELKRSLLKFADRDLIFIDTTGRNPRDNTYIEGLLELYETGVRIDTHLLMSANSDDDFMAEAYKHYSRLPVDCIAFTKVDEAVKLGALYNLASLCQKPLGYITTGQRVPQDIEFPDSDRLALMILRSGVA
ncbi:MAG: flagellar biosynthesis protein FlhF [Nitrospirae bacterium]|nr:flagellar biosynthesis protein FlhF [Nitrospirota bacterium]